MKKYLFHLGKPVFALSLYQWYDFSSYWQTVTITSWGALKLLNHIYMRLFGIQPSRRSYMVGTNDPLFIKSDYSFRLAEVQSVKRSILITSLDSCCTKMFYFHLTDRCNITSNRCFRNTKIMDRIISPIRLASALSCYIIFHWCRVTSLLRHRIVLI